MFEKLKNTLVFVSRVQPLAGASPISRAESDSLLKPYGISIASEVLLRDLSFLALGAEIKNRFEVEADVKLRLSRILPWWIRWVPGLESSIEARLIASNIREWHLVKVLAKLRLPGHTFETRFVSVCLAYFYAKSALYHYKAPLAEVTDVLQTACMLSLTASDNERVLLSSLPSDVAMGQLPEALQAQFDSDNVDPDFFFSGEDYKAHYAIGKAVRLLRGKRDAGAISANSHVALFEELLSHPGRGLVLSTSRKLDQFRAFVLEKLEEFIPDPAGDEMRYRDIREVSEIRSVRTSELALLGVHQPLFWKRVMDRSLQVREYGFVEEERPRAHLLIDKSPSMLFFGNLFKAGGVLFNRLLLTLDDAADVSVQLFDERLHGRINIDGPHEAEKVMTLIRMAHFVGSGTNIDTALRNTIAAIKKFPQRKSPDHVILVSDGKGKVDITPEECSLIRLHCFLLGGSNDSLKQISQRTGGIYTRGL